jgi:hypothetical protein
MAGPLFSRMTRTVRSIQTGKFAEEAAQRGTRESPGRGDRGLTDRRRGVGGCGDYLQSEFHVGTNGKTVRLASG